jgi:anti-sigma-K factor RskA
MTGAPHDGPHDRGGDAAAYVLGALEPEEAQAFARHLEGCQACRDEVASLERVVDALPAAAPQYRAPASLRQRVLEDGREHERQRAQAATPPHGTAPPARRRLRWPSRPVLAGAAALAVALIAVVVIALSGGGPPASRVITATVTGPGSARVKVVGGRAELILTNFPAPPPGDVYQVWLQRGSAKPSPTRTLFSVTREGAADVGVTGALSGVSRLMVTPERAGGSLVPTHAPVLVAPLA